MIGTPLKNIFVRKTIGLFLVFCILCSSNPAHSFSLDELFDFDSNDSADSNIEPIPTQTELMPTDTPPSLNDPDPTGACLREPNLAKCNECCDRVVPGETVDNYLCKLTCRAGFPSLNQD